MRILLICVATALALISLHAMSANRDALRQIAQEQCLVHWLGAHSPAPCERLYLPDPPSPNGGYAVLADRKGGAHFLLIPTQTIGGIESPEALEPKAPNYFAAAWQARDRVAASVGHAVARTAIGLAVNPKSARSQDQLHIHVECLRADVAEALQANAGNITGRWSSVRIGLWHYDALRVSGDELGQSNPIVLLAGHLAAGPASMENYTLIVAGMQFADGPGFAVLAGTGLVPAGELLLDSNCVLAGGLP
jgi:CDP-diacylglycerol pyrophosphatase